MELHEDAGINNLISLCRANDECAFEELVSLFIPMITSLASKKGLDFGEAYSDACLALYDAAHTYDVGQSEVTFGLYAKVCVNNRLSDLVRKRNNDMRRMAEFDVDNISVSDGIISKLLREEEMQNFHRKAKGALSSYEYDVLKLALMGESAKAIADALGKDAKSVENAKARILTKLRKAL